MLVVPHDHDVIREQALLLDPVVIIKVIRHIIVDGEYDPLPAAHDRELPDELYVVLAVIARNAFDVHIDAFDPHRFDIVDDLRYDRGS